MRNPLIGLRFSLSRRRPPVVAFSLFPIKAPVVKQRKATAKKSPRAAWQGKQPLPSGRCAPYAPALRAGLEHVGLRPSMFEARQSRAGHLNHRERHHGSHFDPPAPLKTKSNRSWPTARTHKKHARRAARDVQPSRVAGSKRPGRQAGRHGRKRPPLRGAKTGTNHGQPAPPAGRSARRVCAPCIERHRHSQAQKTGFALGWAPPLPQTRLGRP
jgi:hypothetical protein